MSSKITPLVQRQTEQEEEELLQTKQAASPAQEATPQETAAIAAMQGGGHPLPPSERAFFEPRFGHDLSQVRVHTNRPEAEATQAVNARAFTLGRNVFFGAGHFAPAGREGKRLLSHELTHLVQQCFDKPDEIIQWKPSMTSWVFNNGGVSDDNCCRNCTYKKKNVDSELYPNRLRMYPKLQNSETNGMRLQDFNFDYEDRDTYETKREIERKIWGRQGFAASLTKVPNQCNGSRIDDPDDVEECITPSLEFRSDESDIPADDGGARTSSDSEQTTPRFTLAPDDCSKGVKTVTIDLVSLRGSNRDPVADLAFANAVFSQCCVRFVKGIGASANLEDSDSWIGGDTVMQMGFCETPKPDEFNTMLIAEAAFGLTSRIRAFYVESVSSGVWGCSRPPSCGTGEATILHGMVVVSNKGSVGTLAHELGHILLDGGGHSGYKDNLMYLDAGGREGENLDRGQRYWIYENA